MEHMYLYGIMPGGKLLVLGPYDGERDREYLRRRKIMITNGVTANIKWLGTIDKNVATSIIKRIVEGTQNNSKIETSRARHDIDGNKGNTNQTDIDEDIICGG